MTGGPLVLYKPESALCGWIGVILLSLSSVGYHQMNLELWQKETASVQLNVSRELC